MNQKAKIMRKEREEIIIQIRREEEKIKSVTVCNVKNVRKTTPETKARLIEFHSRIKSELEDKLKRMEDWRKYE